MYVVAGLAEVDPQTDIYYNSAVLIGPDGQIVGSYRKIHPFFPDTRWSRKGDLGFPVFATDIGRIGLIVCMDVSFFESTRIPALKGADIIVCPLNSRTEAPNPQWRARALENGVYMVVANRVGLERGECFSGGSAVIDPCGRVVGHLGTEPGLLLSDVDLDNVHQPYAMVGDRLGTRRPEQYQRVLLPSYIWPQHQTLKLPRDHQSTVGVLEMDGACIIDPMSTADAASSLAQLRSLVVGTWQQAKGTGRPLDLLVLPELCMPPGPVPGESTSFMTALAEDLQIYIVFGMAETASSIYILKDQKDLISMAVPYESTQLLSWLDWFMEYKDIESDVSMLIKDYPEVFTEN
jgi:predicted amidohydrolase